MSQTPLECFANCVPINSMRPAIQQSLAKKSETLMFSPGSYIFQIGEKASSALFLFDGEIQFEDRRQRVLSRLTAGHPDAAHRLAHESPRKVSARCLNAVTCLSVDARLLDMMMTWHQNGALEVNELSSTEVDATSDDWMTRLLRMPIFRRIPPSKLQAVFLRMRPMSVSAGEIIVQQGDKGDFFYVVISGQGVVTREDPGEEPECLAALGIGDCFGEDALISSTPRSASVAMLTAGKLMRLAKDDFCSLVSEPLSRKIARHQAITKVSAGQARWLDVRHAPNPARPPLSESIKIPLQLLRPRLAELSADLCYICVCDDEEQSAVAAFMLAQHGLDAYVLEGGLQR